MKELKEEKFQEALLNILEDLKESKGKLSGILSSMTDIVFVLNKDGVFTFYHAPKNSLLYAKPERFIGTYYSKILPPNVVRLLKEKIIKTLEGKTSEVQYSLKINNNDYWFNAKISPLKIDNKIEGSIAVVSDITKQKKAEEMIKGEKDKLQKYFDISGLIVLNLDTKGNVLTINKKGLDVLNCKEEIIGKNWFDLCIPDKEKNEVCNIHKANIKGKITEYHENIIYNSKGEERIISWHNTLIKDNKEKIIGTLSTGEDITDKKQKEEELIKLREEDEINQARKNFLLLITHELKQPLTPIMGYADLLKEQVMDINQLKYLDRIIGGAQEMYELITKIINLMRIETGQLLFNFRLISLKELILDSLRKKASLINLRNIKIETNIKDINFIADYNLLRDVMINLIDNAIKFSKEHSKIMINAKKEKDKIKISIIDQGIGISKDNIKKLFKTFSQTIEGRKKGGFGIGLSLIKMIVEKHKGTVSVKSQEGKGSNFIINIPYKKKI